MPFSPPSFDAIAALADEVRNAWPVAGPGWTAGVEDPSGRVVLMLDFPSYQHIALFEREMLKLGFRMTVQDADANCDFVFHFD